MRNTSPTNASTRSSVSALAGKPQALADPLNCRHVGDVTQLGDARRSFVVGFGAAVDSSAGRWDGPVAFVGVELCGE